MLRLKENIGSLSGIQAVALSNPIYEWPLGEFSPDGTYESYTSEDGDEEIMEVMGYKLLKGLPWKEAIERYPHPVYLNRTWLRACFRWRTACRESYKRIRTPVEGPSSFW